jgi:hypothetical protein
MLVMGFEIPEVLAIFMMVAVLNFLCSSLPYGFLLTWGPPAALAVVLRVMKRNKPENYLLHWARYIVSPGEYSAFTNYEGT